MKKIIAAAVVIMTTEFCWAYEAVDSWVDNKCIGYTLGNGSVTQNSDCGWCDPTGTPPPGNCIKGYAGCTKWAYISAPGEFFHDANGNIVQQTNGTTTSTWRCDDTGWTEVKYETAENNCDRYTYFNPILNMCVYCPASGVFDIASGAEVITRGDNYEQLLTGCRYYI